MVWRIYTADNLPMATNGKFYIVPCETTKEHGMALHALSLTLADNLAASDSSEWEHIQQTIFTTLVTTGTTLLPK